MSEISETTTFEPFIELVGKEAKPYQTVDSDGRSVTIQPKREGQHTSGSTLDDFGPVFYNLGQIVEHPHKSKPSTSQNPKAIEHRRTGQVIEYSRRDFIPELNMPGHDGEYQDTETTVVVKYPNDGSENHSLTFYTRPARDEDDE
jgi:hypothetical protein